MMFKIGHIVQHDDSGAEYVVISRDAHRNYRGNIYVERRDFGTRRIKGMSHAYYLCRNVNTDEQYLFRHEELTLSPEQHNDE